MQVKNVFHKQQNKVGFAAKKLMKNSMLGSSLKNIRKIKGFSIKSLYPQNNPYYQLLLTGS